MPVTLLTIAYLVGLTVAGLGILGLFGRRGERLPAEVWLPQGFGLGLGLQTLVLLASLLLTGRIHFGLLYAALALGVLGLAADRLYFKRLELGGFDSLHGLWGRSPRPPLYIVVWMLLALILALTLADALYYPIVGYDGQAIWNFKAKILFHERTIFSEALTDPYRVHYHRDYPLLLPLAQAALYNLLGREDEHQVKFLFFAFYCGLAFLCYGKLRQRRVEPLFALFFSLLLVGLPVWQGGEMGILNAGYCDLVFAFLSFLALLAYDDWWTRRRTADLVMGSVFGGLCLLAKNEGVILWMALMGGGLVQLLVHRAPGRGKALGALLLSAALGLAMTIPWFLIKRHLPNYYDETFGGMIAPNGLKPALQRLPHILSVWIALARDPEYWPRVWLVYGLLLALGLRRQLRLGGCFPDAVIILWLLACLAVYCVTPLHIDFHLHTSLGRLMEQLMPFLIFRMGCLAAESWAAFRPRVDDECRP